MLKVLVDAVRRRMPVPPLDLTLRYGTTPQHVIDVKLPLELPAPLMVLIHGGFWQSTVDRRYLGPMARALAAAGYMAAVVEFRRVGMADGGWTGTFDDIAAALDQVAELAEPHGADVSKITWVGHSSGGHLALWAAARPGLPAESPWRGPCAAQHVVSLAGCCSLRLCAEWNLGNGAARKLMGGMPDEVPERYAVADPEALPPPSVPVTLIHGMDDDAVPVGMSGAFKVGRLVEIPGAGHRDLVDPRSPAWRQVLSLLGDSSIAEAAIGEGL